jgi:hypothetical protein
MRRREKEIKETTELEEILGKALVCRIGLAHGGIPYVVPVIFGYEDGSIYFHSSPHGRKMEMLRENPLVCFEVEVDVEIIPSADPCSWGVRFRSVIGTGKAFVLQDFDEKARGLEVIMRHYSSGSFSFPREMVDATAVVRVEIQEMTGKRSP